jgi:hypothetical protein
MPTIKRLSGPLIAMFGMIIAMVAFALPANAAPYATQPTTSVSNGAPTAGSAITFCGQGFAPGETVTVTLDNGTTYPSVTADASGAFCTTIVLGANLSGNHAITARGVTSGRTSSTAITVQGVSASAATTTSGGLAFTGAAVIGLGALGGALLVGGAIMVVAGRRRKANA